MKRLESDLDMQYQPFPLQREDDDDVVVIEDDPRNELNYRALDRLVGETQQGEAVYEDRESGDLYEER